MSIPIFERPFVFPASTTALFTLSISCGMLATEEIACTDGACGLKTVAMVSLALAFVVLSGWFLHAFTRCDEPLDAAREAQQRASMFRFAYSLSVFAFALLLLPFTALLRGSETAPDAGPIRLLRACVVAAPAPSQGESSPRASSPVEICPREEGPKTSEVSYYPWLVSVGGVLALECGGKRGPACVNQPKTGFPTMYRLQGGFAVPFYVLVFAFVGGVVNLTRRVPEYQKRSSQHFAGTEKEPVVTLLEAREFVIFQIMQFLSAPFIAMVAYYAFDPKGVTTAAVTGFFAGFATESVLLLLRGMFNGLRPETTKPAAAGIETANLHVSVKLPAAGGPAAGAIVEVQRVPRGATSESGKCDALGEVIFNGMASGTVWVSASSPVGAAGELKVQLKPGETESIELRM